MQNFDLPTFKCAPLENSAIISGQQSTTTVAMFFMNIRPCNHVAANPSQECAAVDEIADQTANIEARLMINDKYFDSKEFEENPVKRFLRYKVVGIVDSIA